MKEQPTLEMDRLILRPFTLADADDVRRLAGDRAVADTTLNIPHPYPSGAAEAWINLHAPKYDSGELATFAITRRDDGCLLGAVGLQINHSQSRAELGYWVGLPFWNCGYCTEAASRLLEFAFAELGLHRVLAYHLTRNPASGRVMQKIGMIKEGELRQHSCRWGKHEDLVVYGILADEYQRSHQDPPA